MKNNGWIRHRYDKMWICGVCARMKCAAKKLGIQNSVKIKVTLEYLSISSKLY